MSDPTSRWRHELERLQREIETECRKRPGRLGRGKLDHDLREAASLIGDALWHLRRQTEPARVSGPSLAEKARATDDGQVRAPTPADP
jgi:hypothetical protein